MRAINGGIAGEAAVQALKVHIVGLSAFRAVLMGLVSKIVNRIILKQFRAFFKENLSLYRSRATTRAVVSLTISSSLFRNRLDNNWLKRKRIFTPMAGF
jgi:hypothetical protein